MKPVCIIPARGGSKRIPRKNVRPFLGKPIIAYSIAAAQASGVFHTVIVSTDDEEIADVARTYGAEVPFIRPRKLSDDHTPTRPVIQHAVKWCAENGLDSDNVCWMHAAAPLIASTDVHDAYEMLRATDFDFVFTATQFEFPIQRALRLNSNGSIEMFYPEHRDTRSQDLPVAYHDAGQFYFGSARSVMEGVPVFSRSATIFEIPSSRAQDIDTLDDWRRVELMYQLVTGAKRDSSRESRLSH